MDNKTSAVDPQTSQNTTPNPVKQTSQPAISNAPVSNPAAPAVPSKSVQTQPLAIVSYALSGVCLLLSPFGGALDTVGFFAGFAAVLVGIVHHILAKKKGATKAQARLAWAVAIIIIILSIIINDAI